MSKVSVMFQGRSVGVGTIEPQPQFDNDVVRGDDGSVLAFSSHSGVFGAPLEWLRAEKDEQGCHYVYVTLVPVQQIQLHDLETADLDALLGSE